MAECKITKIAFAKGRLNFNSKKSTTAASVHLMESLLLDNWLKNNHATVDISRILHGGKKVAALTREILFLPQENKIHIVKLTCHVLFII